MNELTTEEQASAIYDHVRAAYVDDPVAVFNHSELMALAGRTGKPDTRFYEIMSMVRGRLKSEGILLRSVRKVGYRFLNASDHGRHALHKLDLAIANVDAQRETLGLFIDRVHDGEETGFDAIEIAVMETFEISLRQSVVKALRDRDMLRMRAKERQLLDRETRNANRKLANELERAKAKLAKDATKRRQLSAKARRQEKRIKDLKDQSST